MALFRSLWSRAFKRPPDAPDARRLIECLLNKANDLSTRDDCATDLYAFDLPEVERALVSVASSALEEETLVDSAGHSLWQIYNRQGRAAPPEVLCALQPSAKKFFETHDV